MRFVLVCAVVAVLQAKYPMLGGILNAIAPICVFGYILYRLFKSSKRAGSHWHRHY